MLRQGLSREEIDNLPSIWRSPGYAPAVVAAATAFGAWTILLPVLPLAVLADGGGESLAGATTGVFMATTVATQIVTPRITARFDYAPSMAVAALLMGLPALGYLLGFDPLPVLGFSAVRGIGFGILTVGTSAVIAELVPARLLGKATGTLGMFHGLSQLICLPTGLAIAESGLGFAPVFGIAALVGVVAAVVCLLIPATRRGTAEPEPEDAAARPLAPRAETWKLVTVPAIAMFVVAMAFGTISNFLPAAVLELDAAGGAVAGGLMLSLIGAAGMVSRYAAGMIADRRGAAGATLIPGLAIGVAGLLALGAAFAFDASLWLVVVAVFGYGLAFGFVQNEALLTMFARLPRSRTSQASAIWNISYDSGTGVGSFLLGFVAAASSFAGTFAAAGVLLAGALAVTVADRVAGRHRLVEYANTRARLRQVPVARRAVRAVRRVAHRPIAVGTLLRRRAPRIGWRRRRPARPAGMGGEEIAVDDPGRRPEPPAEAPDPADAHNPVEE